MEELLDLVADFAVGNFDVVFSGAVVGHEGEETIVSDIKLQSHISLAVPSFAFTKNLQAGIPGDGH
jgi:hypothetical protein